MTGALLVGDSVRGSLRDLALERLGAIDRAVLSETFFREAVAPALGRARPEAAPVILLSASVVHAGTGARAGEVSLLGVDARFDAFYPQGPPVAQPLGDAPRRGIPPAVLNAPLAEQLGARAGDALLITLPRPSVAPADSPMGRRELEQASRTVRATVAAVVPGRGAGRFGLAQAQGAQPIAWLPLADLQRFLEKPGRVNGLLIAGAAPHDGASGAAGEVAGLVEALEPEDRGLTVTAAPGYVAVESQEFVLRPAAASLLEEMASGLGGSVQRVRTTVAVSLRRAGAPGVEVPYSTITAIDPTGALPALTLADGRPAPALEDDEILLGEWAAAELQAAPGDAIEVDTFTLSDAGRLGIRTDTFRVAGVTRLEGLGADRTLTPTYPGIQDARHIADWDPPFPVDLKRVRPRDEDYWDAHGATPKAFVAESAGRKLWAGRHGSITALRVAPLEGTPPAELARRLAVAIRERLPLEATGIQVRPVRAEALRASSGATDFGGLFAALSGFLIVSGALVAGLLFRLGVERRAREIGLLRALGHPRRRVRMRFLAEGAALAGAGILAGLPFAVAHAALLMAGLRGAWQGAVGTSLLTLHVRPASLAIGGAVAFLSVMAAIGGTVRRLGTVEPARLLAGGQAVPGTAGTGRAALLAAWGGALAAAVLALWLVARGEVASPALSLAAGGALLISALGWFARWCRHAGRRRPLRGGRGALLRMAARNGAWNPGRSVLSVTLIASACFVLAAVAAGGGAPPGTGRGSGTGGFSLVASTEIPLHADPGTPEGRSALGLPEELEDELRGAGIVSLRDVPGDDISCLNLYRPQRPRLVGVSDAMIARGGFLFAGTVEDVANPWELLRRPLPDGAIPAIGDRNSVQWILHLGLGSDLIVRDDLGQEMRIRFVALLSHSIFQSEVLIGERDLLARFPGRGGRSFFLIEAPEEKTGGVASALESALSREGFDAEPAAGRLERYREVERTYLSTFQLLGSLGLLLGTCGLGIVMARTMLERRGELAALRAMGFTRRTLRRLVLAESAVLVTLGAGAGTLAALAALAPRLVAGAAHPAWVPLVATLGLVIATGITASLIGAAIVMRSPLVPALRDER